MKTTMVRVLSTPSTILPSGIGTEARDINFVWWMKAHIVTVNPLLSPLCDQSGENVARKHRGPQLVAGDPRTSMTIRTVPRKYSNMAEWWVCLTMPQKKRWRQSPAFKTLSEERNRCCFVAAKLSGTLHGRGGAGAESGEALFRVVQPSLYLALQGMTEKEEKQQRRVLMEQYGCGEAGSGVRGGR